MKTYVKKPVKIQAFEWDGTMECLKSNVHEKDYHFFGIVNEERYLAINTLEGLLKCSVGDYVIRGIRGEYYSCKPDVFKATYEEVK